MGYFAQPGEIRLHEGIVQGLEKAIRALLVNSEFSPEKIARLVEVPVSLVRKIKKELSRMKLEKLMLHPPVWNILFTRYINRRSKEILDTMN